MSSAAPAIGLFETDAAANNKGWQFTVNGGVLSASIYNDALVSVNWLTVTRSSNVITNISFLAPPKVPSYTVATLPSASTSGIGAVAIVTDATLTAITGLGLQPIGSGANKVMVYSDGTNWFML